MKKELKLDTLTGTQKAAIVLMSIGEDQSREILKHFSDEEIGKIGECMMDIKYVPQEVLSKVLEEFQGMYKDFNRLTIDGQSFLKKAVKGAIPKDRADKILAELDEKNRELPFTSLKNVNADIILDHIKGEHPQTIALVLTHLDSDKAAAILGGLPKEIQPDVVMRIAELSSVPPEIVYDIDRVLQAEIAKAGDSTMGNINGLETVAEMLNKLDRSSEEYIFSKIDEEKQQMANEIRQLMFVFEDLMNIDDKGIREILKSVESQQLLYALKTASQEMRDKVFKNLSARAAEMLSEDMEVMGPVRLKEVEEAQQNIVRIARQLESEGKISVGKTAEDVFV
ncbi:MAG: flagellar motor switch protein FliG [Pseudomonadota bacterium]